MCFSISPYVRLRVPAYLGTRGLIKYSRATLIGTFRYWDLPDNGTWFWPYTGFGGNIDYVK